MFAVFTPAHHLTGTPDVRTYCETLEQAQEVADKCNAALKSHYRNYYVVDMSVPANVQEK